MTLEVFDFVKTNSRFFTFDDMSRLCQEIKMFRVHLWLNTVIYSS